MICLDGIVCPLCEHPDAAQRPPRRVPLRRSILSRGKSAVVRCMLRPGVLVVLVAVVLVFLFDILPTLFGWPTPKIDAGTLM